jgi:hypothetical protein
MQLEMRRRQPWLSRELEPHISSQHTRPTWFSSSLLEQSDSERESNLTTMIDESEKIWGNVDLILNALNGETFHSTLESLFELEESVLHRKDLGPQQNVEHFKFWIQLQRAALNEVAGHLQIAQEILTSVRNGMDRMRNLDSYRLGDCFCIEATSASLLQARVWTDQGRFESVVRLLDELILDLQSFPYHGDEIIFDEIESLMQFCLENIGRDEPGESSPDRRRHLREQEELSVTDHWRAMTPLCGHNYSEIRDNYFAVRQNYESFGGDSKYEALNELIEFVMRWCEGFDFATLPKRLLIVYLLWRARIEIEKEWFAELEISMEMLQFQLEELLEISGDNHVDFLLIVRSLIPLATEITFHEYPSEELRARYFPVGYGCVVTGEMILNDIFEGSPVSPALALVMSLLSDTASSINEILGRFSESISEMHKSVAIVDELLRRDGSNPRALRLKTAYDRALRSTDEVVASQVKNWNWTI